VPRVDLILCARSETEASAVEAAARGRLKKMSEVEAVKNTEAEAAPEVTSDAQDAKVAKEDGEAAKEDAAAESAAGDESVALATHDEELTEEELNTVRDCESIGGEEEFMLMIIELLANGLDEKLTKAFESFPKDDWEGVWRQAHSIKGSSLQCSLNALGNIAMEVELYFKKVDKEGETPDRKHMADMLNKLAYESRRVQNATVTLKAKAEAEEDE